MSHTFAFIQNFSFAEIAIVGLIVVLLFGAKRLPELFGSLGKSINEFKRGMREEIADVEPVSVEENALPKETKSV